jgi:hypothetical protein
MKVARARGLQTQPRGFPIPVIDSRALAQRGTDPQINKDSLLCLLPYLPCRTTFVSVEHGVCSQVTMS